MSDTLNIPVDNYTSPSPVCVNSKEKIVNVLNLMQENHCRHIPVVDDKKVVGILSERDIYKAYYHKENCDALLAKDLMTKNVYRVNKNENLEKVVFYMSDKKIGSALVEDDLEEIAGIFTATDALNALVEIMRCDLD